MPVVRTEDGGTRQYGATPPAQAMIRIPEYLIGGGPEPDRDARELIWRRALSEFPGALSDDEYESLAALDITGGYIRAAVISAAYKAAAMGETIERHHVLAAARDEWRKSGRLNFPEQQFTRWSTTTE